MKYFICTKEGVDTVAEIKAKGGTVLKTWPAFPRIAYAELADMAVVQLDASPKVEVVDLEVPGPRINQLGVGIESYQNVWGVRHIHANVVHLLGNHGEGVRVGIVDTGGPVTIQDHSDITTVDGRNFVNPTLNWKDDHGHGTHVHGIIAGLLNGFGIAGVAPMAEIYHAKVLNAGGSAGWATIIDGLNYLVELTEGGTIPVVSNHSYGGSQDPGLAVKLAYEMTAQSGVHLVMAAGNSGAGNGDTVNWPGKWADICTTVASIDENGLRSTFSSVGSEVLVAAPGGNIISSWLNDTVRALSGTSMATPHVAGCFAIAIRNGHKDPKSLIPISCTPPQERNVWLGHGVIDAHLMWKNSRPAEDPDEDKPPAEWPPLEEVQGPSLVFDASASSDPDGRIVSYEWWTDLTQRWSAPEVQPNYWVSLSRTAPMRDLLVGLRVKDDGGAKAVIWKGFRVKLDPPNQPPAENQPPVAEFTVATDTR